jgi:hypothetical protein
MKGADMATGSSWTPKMIRLQAQTLGTMTPNHIAKLCNLLKGQIRRTFAQQFVVGVATPTRQKTRTKARGGRRKLRVIPGNQATRSATKAA